MVFAHAFTGEGLPAGLVDHAFIVKTGDALPVRTKSSRVGPGVSAKMPPPIVDVVFWKDLQRFGLQGLE